jgi:hypothetical protein
MNLSNLREANLFEVKDWFKKNVELTEKQVSELGSHYYGSSIRFYIKKKKVKGNIFWRLTIIFYSFLFIHSIVHFTI